MTTRNLMSSFLFLTLPAILFVSIAEEKAWRIYGLVSLTTSIFVILIAQTRAVWLGSAIAAFVATALFLISSNRKILWARYDRNIRNSTIAIGVCLIIVFVFNYPPRIEEGERSAAEKAGTITNYASDSSAYLRLIVWKESLNMFHDHPIFGTGAGNWKIEFPRYGLSNFTREEQNGKLQWTEPHNEFISAFCETGIAGGLAFVLVFLLAFYLAIRVSLRKSNNSLETILAIILAAMICGYATISFFDFPNSRVEHLMMFILWLSMLPFGLNDGEKMRYEIPSWIAILLTIPALLLSVQRFIAETHEKQLLISRFEHNWPEVISECNKIYNPRLLSVDALSTPILYYKAEAEGMEGDDYNALRDNLLALQAHPNHFYTLNNTGTCEAKLRNVLDGEVFLRRALAISPNFEESLLNLSALYFNQMKYDSAFECVRKCDTSREGSRGQRIARALWDKRK
jgi:tetratricopeptide (TPR) repeat protein